MGKWIKIFVFFLLSIYTLTTINAQKRTFNDVRNIELKSSGEIKKDNGIVGYYFMYQTGKVNKKAGAYELVLLDQNLNEYASKKIIGSADMKLVKSLFNGKSFFFKFYEKDKQEFSFRHFDENLKEINSYSEKLNTSYERKMAALQVSSAGVYEEPPLYTISDKGYISITAIKDNKRRASRITFYSEEETKWEYIGLHSLEFLQYSEKMILFKTYSSILGLNPKTGDKLFETSLDDSEFNYKIYNSIVNESNDVIITGLYYNKESSPFDHDDLGICFLTINDKGKYTKRKLLSWKKDISELSFNEYQSIYVHDFFQNKNKNLFLVSEEYTTNANQQTMHVEDLVLFEFDSEFNLIDTKIIEKDRCSVTFPSNYYTIPVENMPYLAKYVGGYNYLFTQKFNDKESFLIGYKERKEMTKENRKENRLFFKSVNYKNQLYTNDSIPLKSEADARIVFQGKLGHILIIEYFKKEKKINMSLEQINF